MFQRFSLLRSFATTAIVAGALLVAVPAAAAAPSIVLSLDIYSNCIGGRAAPNAAVNIAWRDWAGAFKANIGVASDTYGEWRYCYSEDGVWLAPLDVVKVSDGTSSRTYKVPNLTLSVDRVSGIASGSGPAGRTLRVCPSWQYSDFVRCHSVRIGQDGHWSYTERDGLARAWIDVYWISPNGDHLHAAAVAQSLTVSLGKSKFSGSAGTPRVAVDVWLAHGAKGNGFTYADEYGRFGGTFVDGRGDPVTVAPGDPVDSEIASDEHWIVPPIAASADRRTDVVTGRCWMTGTAAPYLDIDVFHSGHHRGTALGTTDSDGSFTVDFHHPGGFFSPTNIIRGDRLVISCWQTTSDIAQLKILVE